MPTITKGTITQEDLSFAERMQALEPKLPSNTFEVAVICKELGLGPSIPEDAGFYGVALPHLNKIIECADQIEQAVNAMQDELYEVSENFTGYSENLRNNVGSMLCDALDKAAGTRLDANSIIVFLRTWESAFTEAIMGEIERREQQAAATWQGLTE